MMQAPQQTGPRPGPSPLEPRPLLSRRGLLAAPWLAGALARAQPASQVRLPVRVAHRAASMKMVGDFGVFRLARRIDGLDGVELQVAQGDPNLWDLDAVRRYKAEAHRWGMHIPSLAGVWGRGISILNSPVAGFQLSWAIRAAELLGASVVLVAFFRDKAPDMNDESSFGPVVELLRAAAPPARDAGVTLGLENSLSPAENKKLVDLVDEDNVKVYYDLFNVEFYRHTGQAVPGVSLLGKERICQVHVKNGEALLEEAGPVDWRAAFAALNDIGYEGWYVLESRHSGREQLISSTEKNISFIRSQVQMPRA